MRTDEIAVVVSKKVTQKYFWAI